MTRPTAYLIRMGLFLGAVAAIVGVLSAALLDAFRANVALNGVILLVLLWGVVLSFRNAASLGREITWIESFRRDRAAVTSNISPRLLSPMATMLGERTADRFTLSTTAMRTLLDGISSRLDERRELSRYIIGLLVFLGLLGTFWGLLLTVSSIGGVIAGLSVGGGGDLTAVFEELKAGLQAPLSGMGTAFSSSLFGLAGSLVVGFLELQAGQAQNRFYNELEDWLSAITDLSLAEMAGQDVAPQLRFAMRDVHRSIAELGAKIEGGGAGDGSNEAVRDLAQGIENLVDTLRSEQNVLREWVDEQASQSKELASVLKDLSQRDGGSALTQKKG